MTHLCVLQRVILTCRHIFPKKFSLTLPEKPCHNLFDFRTCRKCGDIFMPMTVRKFFSFPSPGLGTHLPGKPRLPVTGDGPKPGLRAGAWERGKYIRLHTTGQKNHNMLILLNRKQKRFAKSFYSKTALQAVLCLFQQSGLKNCPVV